MFSYFILNLRLSVDSHIYVSLCLPICPSSIYPLKAMTKQKITIWFSSTTLHVLHCNTLRPSVQFLDAYICKVCIREEVRYCKNAGGRPTKNVQSMFANTDL